jgi:hypothetical protein
MKENNVSEDEEEDDGLAKWRRKRAAFEHNYQ